MEEYLQAAQSREGGPTMVGLVLPYFTRLKELICWETATETLLVVQMLFWRGGQHCNRRSTDDYGWVAWRQFWAFGHGAFRRVWMGSNAFWRVWWLPLLHNGRFFFFFFFFRLFNWHLFLGLEVLEWQFFIFASFHVRSFFENQSGWVVEERDEAPPRNADWIPQISCLDLSRRPFIVGRPRLVTWSFSSQKEATLCIYCSWLFIPIFTCNMYF